MLAPRVLQFYTYVNTSCFINCVCKLRLALVQTGQRQTDVADLRLTPLSSRAVVLKLVILWKFYLQNQKAQI